jgi:hypothetical protein
MFIGSIPFMIALLALVAVIRMVLPFINSGVVAVVVFAAFGLTWLWACFRWMLWPCPRCQQTYFYRGVWGNAFRRTCAHCGLPKWANPLQHDEKANL